jgi:hypothetical protein
VQRSAVAAIQHSSLEQCVRTTRRALASDSREAFESGSLDCRPRSGSGENCLLHWCDRALGAPVWQRAAVGDAEARDRDSPEPLRSPAVGRGPEPARRKRLVPSTVRERSEVWSRVRSRIDVRRRQWQCPGPSLSTPRLSAPRRNRHREPLPARHRAAILRPRARGTFRPSRRARTNCCAGGRRLRADASRERAPRGVVRRIRRATDGSAERKPAFGR